MQTIEYRDVVDKTGWPDGQWQSEPDKIQWLDPDTRMACLINRHPAMGHFCGYVGVPPGHRFHGADADAVEGIGAYYGLTFSGPCHDGDDKSRGVCHVPDPGEPDEVWWLGFDCAHLDDLSPAHTDSVSARYGATYKTAEFVQAEVASLAKELR